MSQYGVSNTVTTIIFLRERSVVDHKPSQPGGKNIYSKDTFYVS